MLLTYAGLGQKHRQILIYKVDKQNLQSCYQFQPIFLLLHLSLQLHCTQDQCLLKHVTSKFQNLADTLQTTQFKFLFRQQQKFSTQFLPVWYIGISSPSANSRIKVPDTGELLSSSKVSLRETRFLADTIRQSKKNNQLKVVDVNQ